MAVDITTKVVRVAVDGVCSVASLVAAVKSVGFDAVVVGDAADGFGDESTAAAVRSSSSTVCLRVDGMKCVANCGSKVQRALTAMTGVSGTKWAQLPGTTPSGACCPLSVV